MAHPNRVMTQHLLSLSSALLWLAFAATGAARAADFGSGSLPGQGLGSMGLAGGAQLGGMNFQPRWSVGADRVNLDNTDDASDPAREATLSAHDTGLYSLRGVRLSGMGTLPINQGLSLFGKIGVLNWSDGARALDGSMLYSANNGHGMDMTYGAGGQYMFSPELSLHAEWDRYTINQNDVDLFSAGLRYHFK